MRYHKRIEYSREDKDFAMFLDDELIGYACTNHTAECELDRMVYERMRSDGRDLAPAANLYARYQQDAAAFWREITHFTQEQREAHAVTMAVYATVALGKPTTPEAVISRWNRRIAERAA